MASLPTALDSPATLPASVKNRWQIIVDFLVRRRIAISVITFALLIGEDLLTGERPHSLTDPRDIKSVIGLTLVLAGIGLRSWAAGILKKLSQLATTGPYGVIRHPLYVGSFLIAIGFCVLIDDTENICFVLGPFLLLYVLGIWREERRLSEHFGANWQSYAQATPRFFPRRVTREALAGWNLGQWLNNREYRAACTALVGLLAIQMWRQIL
jgi:protein-S-isoprenylcysteine O-methyltransferase Ste14